MSKQHTNWKVYILDKLINWYSDPNHDLGYDTETESCVYYKNSNTRCAVGCLVPESLAQKFESNFKGKIILYIFEELQENNADYEEVKSEFNAFLETISAPATELIYFLLTLQSVHDSEEINKDEFLDFLNDTKKDLLSNTV